MIIVLLAYGAKEREMGREFRFPVWGTQGGGLAREVNGKYIFVEKPDVSGLDVGDDVPDEWDLAPANKLARNQSLDEQFGF